MANVRISVSKKGTLIAMIALVLLLGGGGGYLLWRVNQKDTVAPTDSSASGADECVCCKKGEYRAEVAYCALPTCTSYNDTNCGIKCEWCSGKYYLNEKGWCCPLEEGGTTPPSCPSSPIPYYLRDGTEKSCDACPADKKPVGQRCLTKGEYRFECGVHCFDPSCGQEACDNLKNPPPSANVTLKYTAGAGGSISGDSSQTVTKGGNGTEVTAVPDSGYVFDGWSDDPAKGATRTDSNVQANATYTASFKKAAVDTFTLTYIAGVGGSINGSSSQTVTKGGNGSPVTAVANNGYVFDGWSDDPAKGATRTDKNVQASATYTASFKTNAACGDGKCADDENPLNCPADCPSVCGDGMCTGSEDSSNCPVDCGSPVVGSTVPQTGLFDETKNIVIMGVVLLVLGITWTWLSRLPKKAYTSIKTVSKASSEYISNIKVEKERNIRKSRRDRLEKRIK